MKKGIYFYIACLTSLTSLGMEEKAINNIHDFLDNMFHNQELNEKVKNHTQNPSNTIELYVLKSRLAWYKQPFYSPSYSLTIDLQTPASGATEYSSYEQPKEVKSFVQSINKKLHRTTCYEKKLFYGIVLLNPIVVAYALDNGAEGEAIDDDPLRFVTCGGDPIFYLASMKRFYELAKPNADQKDCDAILDLFIKNKKDIFIKRRDVGNYSETPLALLYDADRQGKSLNSGFKRVQKKWNFFEEQWQGEEKGISLI